MLNILIFLNKILPYILLFLIGFYLGVSYIIKRDKDLYLSYYVEGYIDSKKNKTPRYMKEEDLENI